MELSSHVRALPTATESQFLAMLDDEMLPDANSLPENLLQIMAWTLGEYGYLASELGGDDGAPPDVTPVVERLVGIANRVTISAHTRGFLLSALMKLTVQTGTCAPAVVQVFARRGWK